jgi:hypothetical protein
MLVGLQVEVQEVCRTCAGNCRVRVSAVLLELGA